MLKKTYHLCDAFGIPINLDRSVFILALLLIMAYPAQPFTGLLFVVTLLTSIVLHELGHSLTAMAFGCRVRDITLLFMGGCATLLNLPKKAWQELLVALAGPAVSLALATAGLFLGSRGMTHIGGKFYFSNAFTLFLFQNVGMLNLTLFIFNLLPAFPMDGGRVLRATLQHFFMTRVKATWVASRIGRAIAALMALSVLFSFITGRFESFLLIRLYIAFFIFRAADQEYRMVLAEEGHPPPGGSPFSGFSGTPPPPDDGKALVSPPPYARRSTPTRVDVHKGR